MREAGKRHEQVIREEFGHAVTEADEVLWKVLSETGPSRPEEEN